MLTENSRNKRGLTIEIEEQYESQTPKHSYSNKDHDSKYYFKRELDIKGQSIEESVKYIDQSQCSNLESEMSVIEVEFGTKTNSGGG